MMLSHLFELQENPVKVRRRGNILAAYHTIKVDDIELSLFYSIPVFLTGSPHFEMHWFL